MADNNDDLAAQLSLMNKINAVVQTIANNAQKVRGAYASQYELSQKMLEILNQLSNVNASGVTNLNEKLSQTATEMANVNGDPFDALAKQALGASGSIDIFGSKLFKTTMRIGVAGAMLKGLVTGFKNVIGLTRGVFGFLKGVADLAWSVTAAIISIPFRILKNLMDMAVSQTGMGELRREIEKVREQFGDLKGPASSSIISTTKTLEGFAATGLRAYRIFGTLAERLKTVREVAFEMGATFGIFTQEFKENGGALLAYQKGLGVTNEQMKGLASRAITTGKTVSKVMNDMTKQTLSLGKAFGIDQKLIGKDMAAAVKDVKHFGAVTVKEIGVASVYARKLGVEIDKIVGTLGAFETFDTAAENSAKLSQSFGVQVDAFKLMEAQNPAEQIDMLRQQFKQAGVDSSVFNRQQLKLLATTTGLDEATAQQVFSAKNYGTSLSDIQKKAEVNEKKQLSQAEAMSKLADSIERLIKDGPQLSSSFFDMFLMGIDRGIKRSPEFMRLMRNIRRSLREVMMAGVQLGRYFVENFAGVKDVIGGLADAFSPRIFGGIARTITQQFKLLAEKKISFETFVKNIYDRFAKFFTDESGPMKRVLSGLKTFFIRLADLAGPMIAWLGTQMGKAMGALADFILNPKIPTVDASGAQTFIGRIMTPLLKGFEKAKPTLIAGATKLFYALLEVLKKIANDPKVQAAGKALLGTLATLIFGPVAMNGLAAFAINMLIKHLGGALLSGVSKALISASPGVLSSIVSTLGSWGTAIVSAGAATFGAVAAGLAVAGAAVGAAGYAVNKTFEENYEELASKFGKSNAEFGLGVGSFVNAITLGFLPDDAEKSISKFFAGIGGVIDTESDSFLGTIAQHAKFAGAAISDTLNMYGSWITGVDKTNDAVNKKRPPTPPQPPKPPQPPEPALSPVDQKKKELDALFEQANIEEITADNVGDRIKKLNNQIKRATTQIPILKSNAAKLNAMITDEVTGTLTGVIASIGKINASLKNAPAAEPIDLEIPSFDFGDRLEDLSRQMSRTQSAIARIQRVATGLQRSITTNAIKPALDAVRQTVALVQALDDALNMAPNVDVSAKLERLAGAAGLGSRASYQVKGKDVVINLNLNITMDVDKVEKVMIMRKESIIRDRLNFATVSNPGSQASQEIPETYADKVPRTTRR